MKTKNLKISLIINLLILVLVTLGTIFMVIGFSFMGGTQVLTSTGFSPLKYYTVDSNILVGIASLLIVIYECRLSNNKIKEIPKFIFILKYVSTVAVCLTFLVTLFYLAPLYGNKFLFLYKNSNLFFHLLVPILSFISFTLYEKANLEFKHTFYGISTMILYGVYYATNIFIHQKNGVVTIEYDWYSFVKDGVSNIFIVFPVMIIFTYLISVMIYKLNKK
ncbi:MAG: hypothetical protein E7158_00270 [Firmicutes bacterium]|nr:hypothetical protein [Bacillota bacterium]